MYDNKIFRTVTNTDNGEVGDDTRFHYHQAGQLVWAEYSGGAIVKGFLLATVTGSNELDMRYQHVNRAGELKTGRCHSVPELLPDGRIRLHETWQWTHDRSAGAVAVPDEAAGTSILEEVSL